jgi:hypothetical protein
MARRQKLGLLVLCAAGLLPLSAQKVVSARAGLITFLPGSAFINGKPVVLKTARYQQMEDGDIFSTVRYRAEVLLAPGVVLRLAENSQLRITDTQLSDTRIQLQQGQAIVEVIHLAEDNRIQVELGETTTEFSRPGLYRFGISQNAAQASTHPIPSTLRVYGGEAMVRSNLKAADVKRGMAVSLDADLAVSRFDRKQRDGFHDWAGRRSFELFMSDPETREKQNHWQLAGAGYIENKNFGMEFRAFLRRGLPPPARPPVRTAENP